MKTLFLQFLFSFAMVGFLTPAEAVSFSGSSQSSAPANFSAEKIISFAKNVERVMAEQGARIAILARVGRPPSEMPKGMHYTHVAFAVYSEISTSDGRKLPGYAIYNLYQQDKHPDLSDLVQDYPVDFFSSVASLEAGIIIPSTELQNRLLAVITSPVYSELHEKNYSLIANPYTLGRQNCTEFVLDVVNAAIYQTSDIKLIKANTKAYFIAQPVDVSPLKLLLGSMLSAEVSLADHPGKPVTATFEKIGEYLKKYDPETRIVTVFP